MGCPRKDKNMSTDTIETVKEITEAPASKPEKKRKTRSPKPTINMDKVFETEDEAKVNPPKYEETTEEKITDENGKVETKKVKTGNVLEAEGYRVYKICDAKDKAYAKFIQAKSADQALAILAGQKYTAEVADPKARGRAKKIDPIYVAYLTMAISMGDKATVQAFFDIEGNDHYKAHVIESGVMPEDFLG